MARYGLIGRHLSHSFSQQYFARKFEQEGLRGHRYDLFEMEAIEELPRLVADTPGLCGLNVTIPYKQAVVPFLHVLDPVAAAVGAVNTIRISEGVLSGYNTDVDGLRATLLPLLEGSKPRTLVLGSGGASRAVVYVLKELGIKFRVVSRSRETGDLTWDLLDPSLVSVCPLIINTTPLGMFPNVDGIPDVPLGALGPKHCVVDLIYNPERTRLLYAAEERGARVQNGLAMLHAQAEASWRVWNM
ncbi:MAG: shikimate dehydrogenase [Flavobacteriales bacterium]|nr:shikimate dehydrogenase [Flavobacteriales bacterium]